MKNELKIKIGTSYRSNGIRNASKDFNKLTNSINKSAAATKKYQDRMKMMAHISTGYYAVTKSLGYLNSTIGEFIELSKVQQQAESKLEATLKATGYASGFTADELKKYASELQNVTLYGDEATLGMMSILNTFKSISGDTYKRTVGAIMDVASVMGQDLNSSAVQLGKALNDPKLGLSALSRVGIQFSDEQKKLINSFVETNNITAAQAIILDELEAQFGGTSEAMAKLSSGELIQLSNQFGDFKEVLGDVITDTLSASGSLSAMSSSIDFVSQNLAGIRNLGVGIAGTYAAMKILNISQSTYNTLVTSAKPKLNAYGAQIQTVTKATRLQSIATKSLSASMRALPHLALISGLTFLASKLFETRKEIDYLTGSFNNATLKAKEFSQVQARLELKKLTEVQIKNREEYAQFFNSIRFEDDRYSDENQAKLQTLKDKIFEASKAIKELKKIANEPIKTIDVDNIVTGAGNEIKDFKETLSSLDGSAFNDLNKMSLEIYKNFQKTNKELAKTMKTPGAFAGYEQIVANDKATHARYIKSLREFYDNSDGFFDEKKVLNSWDNISDGWSDNISMTFANGIQDALDGDFDFGDLASAFSSTIGNSMLQSGMNAGMKNMGNGLSFGAGNFATMGAGFGLSALAAVISKKAPAATDPYEMSKKSFDTFISGLNKASKALENFGNVGSSIDNQITSLEKNIAKYSKPANAKYGSHKIWDLGGTGAFGVTSEIRTAKYDGQTFSISNEAEYPQKKLEKQVEDYRKSMLASYNDKLGSVLSSSMADSLDYSLLSLKQLQGLTAGIDIPKMKEYDKELNNIALSMKNGADVADYQTKIMSILGDESYKRYKNYGEALDLINKKLKESTDRLKSALGSVGSSIDSILSSLNANLSTPNIDKFNATLDDVRNFNGTQNDLDELLGALSLNSSALLDSSNFLNQYDMKFAQSRAKNELENINSIINEQTTDPVTQAIMDLKSVFDGVVDVNMASISELAAKDIASLQLNEDGTIKHLQGIYDTNGKLTGGNLVDGTGNITGTIAPSFQGYATGGYTGNGGVNDIAGFVHGREYVVNAQTTKDLGLNNSAGVFKEILNEMKAQTEVISKQANEIRTLRKETQDHTQILNDIEAAS